MTARLVLASRSPQRRRILGQLGVDFEVAPPDAEEVTDGEPRELVLENALRKARAVDRGLGGGRLVLGVDTAVALDDRTFGKPRDESEARSFLEQLSGRTHEVWSGIALLGAELLGDSGRPAEAVHGPRPGGGAKSLGRPLLGVAVTEVTFRRLEGGDIDWYLRSGEWRERAGGYAIQGRGAALVERIAGDYSNVVGLPVAELARLAPALLRG